MNAPEYIRKLFSGRFNLIAVKLLFLHIALNTSDSAANHCRGGMLPPECIHKYTFQSVIGQIQSAPTVDENAICLLV